MTVPKITERFVEAAEGKRTDDLRAAPPGGIRCGRRPGHSVGGLLCRDLVAPVVYVRQKLVHTGRWGGREGTAARVPCLWKVERIPETDAPGVSRPMGWPNPFRRRLAGRNRFILMKLPLVSKVHVQVSRSQFERGWKPVIGHAGIPKSSGQWGRAAGRRE